MNSRWRPNFLLHWVVDLFCIFIFLLPLASSTNRDAVVLLRVKDSELQDPNGQLSDWLLSSPDAPCNWSGITCDHPHPFGDVVSINFTNFGISGINFPADFCRIRTLRNLNISGNNFGGVISPESLSLCSHLHSIDLSSNLFVGDLPELTTDFANMTSLVLALNNFSGAIPASYGSRLPKLQVLGLFGNLFNGSIPEFFSNLTELIRLEIGMNPNFQPSQIPAEIGRLKKLENLWLAQTNLHGSIPESIGNLTSLTNLDLSENSLTGKIPASIGALTAVTQIELYGNQLSGEIPNIFGNLTSLINFDASENNLTGRIPKSLTFLPLETLHLNDNHLEGEIPENLGLNDRIWQLRLFNNSLSGSLPMNLGLNSGLQEFDVSGNLLEGPLPMNLCFNNQLEILVLFDNKFSGKIPQSYSDCSSLTYVRISNNELSGVVPAGFWSLPNVTVIDLKNNALEGSIPHTVSNAGGLLKLHVSNNRFSGDLPDEICELEELVEMDISRNQFSGELPSCITKLKKLQKFTAQENVITGRIPSTVNAWIDLTELNISDNLLTGEIPYELGALRVLTYLDLSDNQLTGEIPAELTKLRLNKFNLSNNKLQGRVPSGWEISISGLMGNPDLCSPHLKPIPPCRQRKPRSLYLVGILSALAAILLGSFIWLLIKSKKLLAFGSRSKKSWKITAFQRVGFDEEEILASLTRHNLIATGGSGQVYRINLKNGQVVAVKRLWEAKRGPESEEVFQSEVETLGNIRHGCIVKLLFSCSGDDFRVLVYEYMENGSLGDVLHGDKGGTLLDWPRRLAIARGAAQGLAYMHHDCVPTIVHRDVKSNNILLDEEFNPKVADFGLAKTLQKNAEDGVQEASKIAGSYGYIAPEYAYTLKITEKSDVYSFGVVLWELITGKRPIDPSFGENKDIVKWVNEVALSSPEESGNGFVNLNRLIDPRLNRSACNEEEIKLLVNVAFQCTSALPINRPSMRRVVELFKDHSRVHSK